MLFTVALMLPVLAVLASWWPSSGGAGVQAHQILGEMSRTVLPDYAWTTLRLCVMVALGVMLVGLASAAAVGNGTLHAQATWKPMVEGVPGAGEYSPRDVIVE